MHFEDRLDILNLSEDEYDHTIDLVAFGVLDPDDFAEYDDQQLRAILRQIYKKARKTVNKTIVGSVLTSLSRCVNWPQISHQISDFISQPIHLKTVNYCPFSEETVVGKLKLVKRDNIEVSKLAATHSTIRSAVSEENKRIYSLGMPRNSLKLKQS